MAALIIDTSYLIYRSYFAYPHLTYQQQPVGAFFGFAKTIMYLIDQYKPEYLIFANDTPKPTWRHKVLKDYKAGRPEIEATMVEQIPLILNWIQKITTNVLVNEGFEADDCIYTACKELLSGGLPESTEEGLFSSKNPNDAKITIYIMSSDRDLYQLLVFPEVNFIQSKTLKDGVQLFGQHEFISKYELMPEQWVDYKALVGDTSDNLKGLPGVGPKTATKILQEIGCLYNLLRVIDLDPMGFCGLDHGLETVQSFSSNPKNQPIIEKIREHYELIKQTYHLATLQAVPQTPKLTPTFNLQNGVSDFERFGFKSLINALQKQTVTDKQSEALF